jgi:hypothetical protein
VEPESPQKHKPKRVLSRMESKLKIKDRDIDDITRALRDAYDLRWAYVHNVEEDGITETDTSKSSILDVMCNMCEH